MLAHASLPQIVGNYKLIERIGSGATSQVYLAEHMAYKMKFAVKVIQLRSADDTSQANAFKSEFSAIISLTHSGIVAPYDVFTSGSSICLVIEYCPGGDLSQQIKNSVGLPENKLKSSLFQIVSALSYCHQNNIAHRDIKPSNMLIDIYGRIKIADFGLSILTNDSKYISSSQGSLPYSAPEVIQHSEYDPLAADVWSLGVTFYQLSTGTLPWTAKSSNEMREEIVSGKIKQITNDIDKNLLSLIKAMLSIDPKTRPTMKEIEESQYFQDRIPPRSNSNDISGGYSRAGSKIRRGLIPIVVPGVRVAYTKRSSSKMKRTSSMKLAMINRTQVPDALHITF